MGTVLVVIGLGISFLFGRVSNPKPEVILAVDNEPVKMAKIESPIFVVVKDGNVEIRSTKENTNDPMYPFKRDWIWGGYKIDCEQNCADSSAAYETNGGAK